MHPPVLTEHGRIWTHIRPEGRRIDETRNNKHGGFGMLHGLLSSHRVRALLLVPAAALLTGLGGCVAQQGYDQAMAENRSLKDQNQQLLADAQQARSEAEIQAL